MNNKRRGLYSINLKVEKFKGQDENGEDIIELIDREVRGHFSINFWSLLEEFLEVEDFRDTFKYLSKMNTTKMNHVIYFSHKAYCLERELTPVFNNTYQCAAALEECDPDQLVNIFEALATSKLLAKNEESKEVSVEGK